jgi:AcrR family transcriptional regulator
MATATVVRRRGGRKETKAVRREQLIKATIDSLAKRGYGETTLADVADGAGLSRGIVNFHFDSKEKLLVETLRYMADEYAATWRGALERAGPTAAHRLWALMESDFSAPVCNRRMVSAWSAFWAEVPSRPLYQRLCRSYDKIYYDMLTGLCAELEAEGGYGTNPERVMLAFDALGEGLWLGLLYPEDKLTRHDLRACMIDFMVRTFPRHFGQDGVLNHGVPVALETAGGAV